MKILARRSCHLLAAAALAAFFNGGAEAAANDPAGFVRFAPSEIEQDGDLSAHATRMYAHTSAEVWAAAKAQLAALQMKVEEQDEKLQAFRTKPVSISKKWGLPDLGTKVDQIQLQVFVSPFVEPARMHIRVMAIEGKARTVGLAALGNWAFDAIEARLGEKGRKVPAGWTRRAQLARELRGETAKPACGTAMPKDKDVTREPAPAKAFAFRPYYPPLAFANKRVGTVDVSVIILEDGAPIPMRAEGLGEDQPAQELRASAVQTANFWIFDPTRVGACAVPSRASMPITFSMD